MQENLDFNKLDSFIPINIHDDNPILHTVRMKLAASKEAKCLTK